jgi:hypothetical protein
MLMVIKKTQAKTCHPRLVLRPIQEEIIKSMYVLHILRGIYIYTFYYVYIYMCMVSN